MAKSDSDELLLARDRTVGRPATEMYLVTKMPTMRPMTKPAIAIEPLESETTGGSGQLRCEPWQTQSGHRGTSEQLRTGAQAGQDVVEALMMTDVVSPRTSSGN